MITLLGFAASFAIVVVYTLLATERVQPIVFHWANALGWPPVLVGELLIGAYVPLVLTAFFGSVGVAGVIHHYSKRTAPEPQSWPDPDPLHGHYRDPIYKPNGERREAA